MRLTNDAPLDKRFQATQMMIALLQSRVFSLFDLQFILVTGRNRSNEQVSVQELVDNLPSYQEDYATIVEFLGDENTVMQPVGLAIAQTWLFKAEIEAGKIDPSMTLEEFSQNEVNRSFVLFLAMQITESVSYFGKLADD